jgi:hypothetical protein
LPQFTAQSVYDQGYRGLLQKPPFKIILGYLFPLPSAPFPHRELLSQLSSKDLEDEEEGKNPK